MNEPEFRRRIDVYIENDLHDDVGDKHRAAEVLAGRLWPLVNGWQAERDAVR